MAIALEIAAKILICLKIEYSSLNLSIYAVMTPIWILLSSLVITIFVNLIKNR